jgi:membrane protein required for colicin V production
MLDKTEVVIKKEIREDSFFFGRVEAVVPAIIPSLNQEFWNAYVPEKYREEIDKKSDSIYQPNPGSELIDSTYQQRYFDVN